MADRAIDAAETLPEAAPALSDRIVSAYLANAGGDPLQALRAVVTDAMADLCEAERRTHQRERLISHGYVRKGLTNRLDERSR